MNSWDILANVCLWISGAATGVLVATWLMERQDKKRIIKRRPIGFQIPSLTREGVVTNKRA